MHCGYFLVDTQMDLFQHFHCFMVKVVDGIFECYRACADCTAVVELMDMRKCCNFLGDESFYNVCQKLKGNVVELCDYISYLQSLLHMKLFLQY
jgi:hypothetical protein